jgi:hypothetical protein
MVYRYVPLLRSKAGEAIALQNLDAAAKQRIFPIIHLAENVPGTFASRMASAWVGLPLALDGYFNFAATSSGAQITAVANALTAAGVRVVPSVEVGAPPAYVAVARQIAQANHTGLVVKSRLGDLPNLLAWLGSIGATPAQADLVVVAGHVPTFGPGTLNPLTIHSLQNLPTPEAWRSVTLASSAAPKDYATFPLGVNHVPRLDWDLWRAVQPQVPFQLDYGDYGVAHPDLTEPPGVAMIRASVSIRYTLDNEWLIMKGRPTSGVNGMPMATQYLGHAQSVVALSGFGGVIPCWGDARIQAIAALATSSGSRQTWVENGVNRHLSLVADRLP